MQRFHSIDDLNDFVRQQPGLSIYAVALRSISAAHVERYVEVHRNHAGYYFLARIDDHRRARVGAVVTTEYLETIDDVIKRQTEPGAGSEWESWKEPYRAYARRYLQALGRGPHRLLQFARAYPRAGLAEVTVHFNTKR